MKKVTIIGSGFSGLSAASFMAKAGAKVTVLEKNSTTGGRARSYTEQGFMFDMGPSWYWMPDVFESFFNKYGKKASDFYELKRLDPSYRVYFGSKSFTDVPATPDKLGNLFEQLEPGSKKKLDQFLEEGKFKYELGIDKLVRKPGLSLFEFADSVIGSVDDQRTTISQFPSVVATMMATVVSPVMAAAIVASIASEMTSMSNPVVIVAPVVTVTETDTNPTAVAIRWRCVNRLIGRSIRIRGNRIGVSRCVRINRHSV